MLWSVDGGDVRRRPAVRKRPILYSSPSSRESTFCRGAERRARRTPQLSRWVAGKCNSEKPRRPSDVTDEEWGRFELLAHAAKGSRRKRETNMPGGSTALRTR